MNAAEVNATFRLSAIVPNLRKSGALYLVGPCPMCGGKDRFTIKQMKSGEVWLCRHCKADKYHSPIDFIMARDNLAFKEALAKMGGEIERMPYTPPAPRHEAPAPPMEWQQAAHEAKLVCMENLHKTRGGVRAMRWLLGQERLLTHEMIETWEIGYSTGFEIGGLWIPRGVVIPCFEFGEYRYLKIRLVPGDRFKCAGCKTELDTPGACPKCNVKNKYCGVKGNVPGVFGLTTALNSEIVFITEGEFDAMHIWHAATNLYKQYHMDIGVMTTGAESHGYDFATIGKYLHKVKKFVTLFDMDSAGEKGAARLRELIGARMIPAQMPHTVGSYTVKDVTDYVKSGAYLEQFIFMEFVKATVG